MPEYEIKIITSDHDFDEHVKGFLDTGLGVVINPIVDKEVELVSGILVADISGLEPLEE